MGDERPSAKRERKEVPLLFALSSWLLHSSRLLFVRILFQNLASLH